MKTDGEWGTPGEIRALPCELVSPAHFKHNGDRGTIFVFEGEALANIRWRGGRWAHPPTAAHESAVLEMLEREIAALT